MQGKAIAEPLEPQTTMQNLANLLSKSGTICYFSQPE